MYKNVYLNDTPFYRIIPFVLGTNKMACIVHKVTENELIITFKVYGRAILTRETIDEMQMIYIFDKYISSVSNNV